MAEDFEAFAASRIPRLHRTAYLLTRDWALAEDLLQTTLTKVWVRWKHIDTDPDGYVHRTMVNTYNTWWRRKWRNELAAETLPEPMRSVDNEADLSSSIDIWRAVSELPRRQRITIVLRYFLDLTEQQTADAMQCSIGTVKSASSKALTKLRIDPSLAQEGHVERTRT